MCLRWVTTVPAVISILERHRQLVFGCGTDNHGDDGDLIGKDDDCDDDDDDVEYEGDYDGSDYDYRLYSPLM